MLWNSILSGWPEFDRIMFRSKSHDDEAPSVIIHWSTPGAAAAGQFSSDATSGVQDEILLVPDLRKWRNCWGFKNLCSRPLVQWNVNVPSRTQFSTGKVFLKRPTEARIAFGNGGRKALAGRAEHVVSYHAESRSASNFAKPEGGKTEQSKRVRPGVALERLGRGHESLRRWLNGCVPGSRSGWPRPRSSLSLDHHAAAAARLLFRSLNGWTHGATRRGVRPSSLTWNWMWRTLA